MIRFHMKDINYSTQLSPNPTFMSYFTYFTMDWSVSQGKTT